LIARGLAPQNPLESGILTSLPAGFHRDPGGKERRFRNWFGRNL